MPLLVGGHQVGHAQHRDLVDGLEAGEAGAVGGVADVVVGRRRARSRARVPPPDSVDRSPFAGIGDGAAADLLERDQLRLLP